MEGIIKADLKIRLLTRLEPYHNCFDGELFQLYARAGGYLTMLGLGSFSETMLECYQKPFDLDDIQQFCNLADKHKVKYGIEVLFGGPGETEATIKESMAYLPKINYAFFSYGIGVRVSPQMLIYEEVRADIGIKNSSELFFSKFYVSKDLNVEWARDYIEKEVKKHSYRSIKMIPVAARNLI